MRTRRLTVAVASGAIALGAAGFVAYPAFADETPSEAPTASATPTPGESDPRKDRINEALKGLVEDGTITQEQADKVAEKLAGSGVGAGVGGGGPHAGLRGGGPFGMALDEVAEALGMSRDEVQSGLADGKSVKELAEAQGKDVDEVVDALVAAATEKIDQAVQDGNLEQERADEIKGQLEERITDVVENGLPRLPNLDELREKGGDGDGGPRFWHRGGPGERGDSQDGETPEPGATEESSFLGVA